MGMGARMRPRPGVRLEGMRMVTKFSGFCLAVALAAGTVSAKPPGLPVDPRVGGQEPTPIDREFFVPDDQPNPMSIPGIRTSSYRPSPAPESPKSLLELLGGIRDRVLDRMTMPLGPIAPAE